MIGVYDSGVGGLPVLHRLRELLPEADLVYLADQANVPYGERSLDEVRAFARRAVGVLAERGATTVVVACNSASAAALEEVRAAFPEVAVVGIEPAVKPAVAASESGVIGVLATDATFAADRYQGLVDRFGGGATLIPHPCPGWAAAIEESWPEGADETVRSHLAPLMDRGVDTLVLGCTHYTFLSGVIERVTGGEVRIVDPVDPVARQAVRVAGPGGAGRTEYLTTGDPERLAAQVARLTGDRIQVGAAG